MSTPKQTGRFRLSLRSLFVLLTIAGLGLGYWVQQSRVQRKAIDTILSVGGKSYYHFQTDESHAIIYDDETDEMVSSRFTWGPLVWCQHQLGDDYFCQIETVTIDRPLKDLAPLYQLRHLSGMENVSFGQTPITDEVLEHVADVSTIKYLQVRSKNISLRGVEAIATLPRIWALDLTGTQLDDVAIEPLFQCKSLESLRLEATQISDVSVKRLVELPNLRELNLKSTSVSDACLEDLKRMPALETVYLSHTKVTHQSAMKLRRELPNMVISRMKLPDE